MTRAVVAADDALDRIDIDDPHSQPEGDPVRTDTIRANSDVISSADRSPASTDESRMRL